MIPNELGTEIYTKLLFPAFLMTLIGLSGFTLVHDFAIKQKISNSTSRLSTTTSTNHTSWRTDDHWPAASSSHYLTPIYSFPSTLYAAIFLALKRTSLFQ
jgi:hypothetical protein